MSDAVRQPVTAHTPERLDSESPEEFEAFLQWLGMAPRPLPAELGPAVAEGAARNQWMARAQAFDWDRKLGLRELSPPDMFRACLGTILEAAYLEAYKALQGSRSSAGATLDPRTAFDLIVKFSELFKSLPSSSAPTAGLNYALMTPEELELMNRATELAEAVAQRAASGQAPRLPPTTDEKEHE